jgi:hypothetical protein
VFSQGSKEAEEEEAEEQLATQFSPSVSSVCKQFVDVLFTITMIRFVSICLCWDRPFTLSLSLSRHRNGTGMPRSSWLFKEIVLIDFFVIQLTNKKWIQRLKRLAIDSFNKQNLQLFWY